MRAAKSLLFLFAVSLPWATWGYTLEQFQFDTPEAAADFRDLLGELRCVVCQNETLASSQADVAEIMREEVYRLIREGKDTAEVKAHLVDRYSDFVLYDPPLKPTTYLVWFGPFVLVALGAYVLARTLGVKQRAQDAGLSEPERQRLNELLGARGLPRETRLAAPDPPSNLASSRESFRGDPE